MTQKCRFHVICPLYQDCHTCNHQGEASKYCGKYRSIQQHMFHARDVRLFNRFFGPTLGNPHIFKSVQQMRKESERTNGVRNFLKRLKEVSGQK